MVSGGIVNMLLNMAQSTPWELIFRTKCWKRPPNATTLLTSNTNVWRSKILITYQRVMTLSSALLPFIIWNYFRIFARRYTDASHLPGVPLFSLSGASMFTAYGSQDWFYDKQKKHPPLAGGPLFLGEENERPFS